MEKINTLEERIRRAEEIYARRSSGEVRSSEDFINKAKKSKETKIKKMMYQIVICSFVYIVVYISNNNQFVFSEEITLKTKEILSYNIEFEKIYKDIKSKIVTEVRILEDEEQETEENIGGAEYIIEDEQVQEQLQNSYSIVKPVDGELTSRFGLRQTNANIPQNHTGIDWAGVIGDEIRAASEGVVVLVSDEGDYGKHLKVEQEELTFIYAHCNEIYVDEGESVSQGQVIAEIGNTGNSTGPHLHFEIRVNNIPVDPEEYI